VSLDPNDIGPNGDDNLDWDFENSEAFKKIVDTFGVERSPERGGYGTSLFPY